MADPAISVDGKAQRSSRRSKKGPKRPESGGQESSDLPRDLMSFVGSALRFQFVDVFVTLLLSLLATASQLGLGFLLFRVVQADRPVLYLPGFTLEGLQVWLLAGALTFFASLMPYVAERYIVNRTINFFKISLSKVRHALSDREQRFALMSFAKSSSELTRLLSADARYASLAFAGLLRMMLPLCVSIAAIGVLIYIEPIWTLVLLLIVLPFTLWQTWIVFSGIKLNRQMRQSAIEHGRNASRFVQMLSSHFTANRWDRARLTEAFKATSWDNYPNAYGRRLRLGVSAKLASDLAIFGAVVLLIFYMTSVDATIEQIGQIILFAVVARFAMTNISQVISHCISVVSQLPFYENFLSARKFIERLKPSENDEELMVRRRAKDVGVSICYCADLLSWSVATRYISAREESENVKSLTLEAMMLSSRFGMIPGNFVGTFQLPHTMSKGAFLLAFPHSEDRWPEFQRVIAQSENVFEEDIWRGLSPQFKFLITAKYAFAKRLRGRYVFINGTDLAGLQPLERKWLFEQIDGSRAVIFFSRIVLGNYVPDNASCEMLLRNDELVAVGSYGEVKQNRLSLSHYLQNDKLERSDTSADQDSDEYTVGDT